MVGLKSFCYKHIKKIFWGLFALYVWLRFVVGSAPSDKAKLLPLVFLLVVVGVVSSRKSYKEYKTKIFRNTAEKLWWWFVRG